MSRYDKMYLIEITNFYIYDIAMYGSSLIAQNGRAIQPDPAAGVHRESSALKFNQRT
jgi:cytidylate kinase